MKSILSSFRADLFFIMLPGHLCLLIITLLSVAGLDVQITELSLLILIIIDNGHVYTTFIRTTLERRSVKNKYYLFLITFFLSVFALYLINPNLIWKFALYSTIFHYLKQNIGILSFYQALSGQRSNFDKRCFYLLQTLAIVSVHFRTDGFLEYYSSNDLFTYPHPEYLIICTLSFLVVYIIWLGSSLKRFIDKSFDTASFLYVLLTSTLFFLLTSSKIDIQWLLISLIIAHGTPYLFLINKSLRTNHQRIKYPWYLIIYILLIFGGGEYLVGTNFIDFDKKDIGIIESMLAALFLLPLFSHFFMDSIIWKRNNAGIENIIHGKY